MEVVVFIYVRLHEFCCLPQNLHLNLLQENIFKKMEESLKTDGRILQKRSKGNELKFQIIPPKQQNSQESDKCDEKSYKATGPSSGRGLGKSL